MRASRSATIVSFVAIFCITAAAAAGDWDEVLARAEGQTVYFNAWGGDQAINGYIEWAAAEIEKKYGVELRHVKVTDIAESVARIMAEKAAGREDGGSVDLLWINGENFAALKQAGLLYGPWAMTLPNAELIDWEGNRTASYDGGLETAGFELPWGTAALTLFFDSNRVRPAPSSPDELADWIEDNPGRFSYPQPPTFIGTAFLKQLLIALVGDRPVDVERLKRPPGESFEAVTEPLWAWLDRVHPALWRGGRLFPRSGPAQRDLLAVGELDWMISYNPSEASRAIRQGELHDTIGAMQFDIGALGNSHFLAIPWNSGATEGARVVADFLISPAAQARKADERLWGDPTVLDVDALEDDDRRAFDVLETGAATPPPAARILREPHPAWTARLEQAWLERYRR